MLREEAWIGVLLNPPGEKDPVLMDDEQFDQEVALASEGRWDELDLDEIPAEVLNAGFAPSSIEELRNAGG